jgi:invasion protein IalB
MNDRDWKPFRLRPARLLLTLAFALLPGITRAQQAASPDKPVAELAPRGQRFVPAIKYGDWQKYCFKTPGSNMVCRTSISGSWDTGQSAVRADLIEREGEGKARLQLFVPVGLYLPAGIKLTVDHGKSHQVPYVSEVADPALIREMEKGQKLVLEVVDSSVQSVSTTLPLGQFASIHSGPARKVLQQDVDE